MSARRASARRGDQTSRSTSEAGPRRARFPFATLLLALGLSVLVPAAAARAQGTAAEAPIPAAAGLVNDHAGKLDDTDRAKLEAFLDQVKRKTGVEFAVLIMPTTAPGLTIQGARVQELGIGNRAATTACSCWWRSRREVRFEVARHRGTLPDGSVAHLRREMAPRASRRATLAGGITAGIPRCARVAAEKGVTLGGTAAPRYGAAAPDPGPLIIIAMLIAFIIPSSPAARRWRLGRGAAAGTSAGGFGGGWRFGIRRRGRRVCGGSFGGFGGGSSGGGGGGGSGNRGAVRRDRNAPDGRVEVPAAGGSGP
jgi:uncharacterized protein